MKLLIKTLPFLRPLLLEYGAISDNLLGPNKHHKNASGSKKIKEPLLERTKITLRSILVHVLSKGKEKKLLVVR